MEVNALLQKIKTQAETVEFDDVIAVIDEHYLYTETRFYNGPDGNQVVNEAGANAGSCRIFAFAKLNGLDEAQTLACFGRYYREDVLGKPDGEDHANIRNFMRHGWQGIRFDSEPLRARQW